MQDLDAKTAEVKQVLQPLIKAGMVTGVHADLVCPLGVLCPAPSLVTAGEDKL